MQAFFSPDSIFSKAMNRIADLLLLNVYFLLTCIPIFTIGAACTALYSVCFRLGTDREEGITKTYFRSFRDNFRQGTLLWLVIALCGVTACINIYLFYMMPSGLHYCFILFVIAFILVLLISALTFPLLSQFDNDNKSTLRNALILSIGYLPRSLLIAVLNVFPFALLFLNFYAFLQAGFFWIALYFSTAAWINTFLLKKIFAPYIPHSEEENQ